MRELVCTIVVGCLLAHSAASALAGDFLFYKSKNRALQRVDVRLAGRQVIEAPPPAPAAAVDPASPLLLPSPGTAVEVGPAVIAPAPAVGLEAPGAVPIFHRVKYEDTDEMHPCGVPTLVAVPDPCADSCDCAGPRCVYVQICVPPHCEPRVKYSRGGRVIKYEFGDDYEIKIESKRGYVEIEYDD